MVRQSSPHVRLFIAVDLPETVRILLEPLFQQKISGAKWVPFEQVHLTLRFIGEVEEKIFQEIKNTLSSIQAEPFETALQGMGTFPDSRHPRVLWVGLEAPPQLYALQNQVEATLRALGIEPEARPFSPHITLARLKFPDVRQITNFLDHNKDFKSESWLVKEFHLYSSQLTPKGAIHKVEETYEILPQRTLV